MDYKTGMCTPQVPTPTGIGADVPLAARGEAQARELAAHLATVVPAVDAVVCSPFYRCLQTIMPFAQSGPQPPLPVRVEPGIGEFYSRAPYDQPRPAPLSALEGLFPAGALDAAYVTTGVVPGPTGETVLEVHDRMQAALDKVIAWADAEGHRAIVLVSHASPVIAATRVLTKGGMPKDPFVDDVVAYSGGLGTFRRRPRDATEDSKDGGWICESSSDCSFYSDGQERGW
jgi:transcription factor C subunit 7